MDSVRFNMSVAEERGGIASQRSPARVAESHAAPAAAPGPEILTVRVDAIVRQGEGIHSFRLVSPGPDRLPPFTAGAHVDLFVREGLVRQYSISSDPAEAGHYEVTIQREAGGRGGSMEIFDSVQVGQQLRISRPRNNFPLREDAGAHLFLGGGIGITPLMSMAKRAGAIGQPFMLHCCTRSPERTAFLQELRALEASGQAAIHHDGGDPAKGLDIPALLKEHRPGTHLYYCGPGPFMKAVAEASAHWPAGTVHFEFFSPQLREPAARKESSPDLPPGVDFRIRLARSNVVLDVPHDVSIVDVLRENGFEVPTSCEAGVCGSCRVRYLGGRPDHRDYLLEDSEREEELLACCARSLDSEIELDM